MYRNRDLRKDTDRAECRQYHFLASTCGYVLRSGILITLTTNCKIQHPIDARALTSLNKCHSDIKQVPFAALVSNCDVIIHKFDERKILLSQDRGSRFSDSITDARGTDSGGGARPLTDLRVVLAPRNKYFLFSSALHHTEFPSPISNDKQSRPFRLCVTPRSQDTAPSCQIYCSSLALYLDGCVFKEHKTQTQLPGRVLTYLHTSSVTRRTLVWCSVYELCASTSLQQANKQATKTEPARLCTP